ncbi:MAG: molecular chaperone TorD family protein [Thermodesulfobacteriota bacterium]
MSTAATLSSAGAADAHASVTRVSDGIARAARLRLLGLLLERPRPGWRDELVRLAMEIDDPPLRAAVAAARTASEGQYLALLGPGAPFSPREASVVGLGDPGWMLAEIARCYEAFGYTPRAEDPPDHVAVETGFVGFLELKESLAWASGDAEAACTVAAARAAFVERHLAPLVARLARCLEAAPASHLALAVDVLAARIAVQATSPADG